MIKVIGMTDTYAKRVTVTLGWNTTAFFDRDAPEKGRLVTLEFPGLTAPTAAPPEIGPDIFDELEDVEDDSLDSHPFIAGMNPYWPPVLAFLRERSGEGEERPVRGRRGGRDVLTVPAALWRYTVLEDLLDADNADDFRWFVSQQFPLDAFEAFLARHLPEAQRLLATALALPAGADRIDALERAQKPLERIAAVFANTPQRMQADVLKERERVDRALIREAKRVAKARDGSLALAVDEWLALVPRLKTDAGRDQAVRMIGRDLAKVSASPEEALAGVERLGMVAAIRSRTEYDTAFWKPLEKLLTLEATESGTKIDIADATEETVTLGWPVLLAKRVGAITPGRSALVVRDGEYRPTHYVRGGRKLKFDVQKAGGSLERFGCTLTMPVDESARRMQSFLLDVERIDVLSSVDPAAALALVPEASDLPDSHAVRRAAGAAAADFRQARVLADLLIELHTGVDAAVIREMARTRRRGNRQRR